jgi:hypothetical protein
MHAKQIIYLISMYVFKYMLYMYAALLYQNCQDSLIFLSHRTAE